MSFTATASVQISAGGPGPVGGVIEPPDMHQVFNSPFTAPLAASSSIYNVEGWRIGTSFGDPSRCTQIDDSTAPRSPPRIVQIFYPNGAKIGGATPVQVFHDQANWPAQNTGYLWQRIGYKVSSNWSDNMNAGTKFSFFKHSSLTINHACRVTTNGAPRFAVASQIGSTIIADWRAVQLYTFGAWNEVELYVTPGTPGQANGTLQGLLNGQPMTWFQSSSPSTIVSVPNVMWFPAGAVPRYNNIYFEGTYGGGLNPVPHDQNIWWDHWAASVK